MPDMTLHRTPTASEELQRIAEQKQLETENTLLKTALAQSSERCEESLKGSLDVLRTAEQQWQDRQQQSNEQQKKQLEELNKNVSENLNSLNKSIEKLKNVNESLSHTISVQLSKLVNSVQEATVAEVKYSLRENENNLREATDRFEEILNRTCEKFDTDMTAIEKKLDQKVVDLERQQQRFFTFHGVKHVVFWLQPLFSLATLGLVIWSIFFK